MARICALRYWFFSKKFIWSCKKQIKAFDFREYKKRENAFDRKRNTCACPDRNELLDQYQDVGMVLTDLADFVDLKRSYNYLQSYDDPDSYELQAKRSGQ